MDGAIVPCPSETILILLNQQIEYNFKAVIVSAEHCKIMLQW